MKFVIGSWLAFAGFLSAAGLTFTESSKEISMSLEDTKASLDYAFKNESDKPVTIREAKGFCSCTSVQISGGKTFYKPGESGVIRVNLDMGNETGTVDKAVGVFLTGDNDAAPSHQLKIKIHIPVLVEIEPKSVKWETGGSAESKTIRFKMKAEKPIHIKSVTPSTEVFSQELKVIEDGREYELVITPKSTAANALSIFRLETDCTVKNHGVLQAFAVIAKPQAKR
jgi:hypothetical protein